MADFDPVSYMMGQKAGGGGGGGGSSTLADLTDVDISNPTDGQSLVYDAASGKWVNGESAGGGGSLLVTLTVTENQQKKENAKAEPVTTYTLAADKTVGEILTALKAGKCVIYTFTNSVTGEEFTGNVGPVLYSPSHAFAIGMFMGPVDMLFADTANDYPSYDEYEP